MDNKPSQFLLSSQLPAECHCVYGGLQLFQFNYTSHRGSAQPPSLKITSSAIPMLSTCRDSRAVALSTYRTGHRIMSQNRNTTPRPSFAGYTSTPLYPTQQNFLFANLESLIHMANEFEIVPSPTVRPQP